MATNNAINTDTNSFCKTANNLSDVATPATARLNLFIPRSVTTTTTLTATDYGKEVICTGASSYVLTLPTVTSNASKFIDIFSQTTSNALVTITPASGTIAGQSTLVIGTGDGVRIMNDGTNWWVLNQWLQPVSFSATLSAVQSIPNNSATVVDFDGTSFNVGGFFSTASNRFTPLVPGKYSIHSSILYSATAVATFSMINFIVGNAVTYEVSQFTTAANNQITTVVANALISMNGTTDFVALSTLQNSGGAINLRATVDGTRLIGSRVSLF